ncbi:hypothetical protein PFICI_07757 [Pestalotiopsis fici W106-1]|uniref:Uncharacterized protein n=1 Tax=Pestalotiopsis fici (strain W106-1 / CGMCC3.15140) TaxID=1229662 RepID=W3X288_PESFW|nr:uncharacterized protein PFICI_07757 [Pestalotiopsis fici W106-1]ETS80228.1 hypothetical protein PFICI_07757 [Pestalotiopsis fici W106-1]
MSGVNNDHGGHKGKNFNPHHKSIHHGQGTGPESASNHNQSSGDWKNTENTGGRVNRGGYKGKNFDPNYHNRFKKLTHLFDPIAELRPRHDLPPRPSFQSQFDKEIRNIPTGPKSQRVNYNHTAQRGPPPPRPQQDQHDQNRYHHRKRKLDQDADQWMCSCPRAPTRCHSQLLQQYEDDCREYRTQLAAGEHDIEVLGTTLQRFARANPDLEAQLVACYEAVEREIIEQEYAYFRESGPENTPTSNSASS